MELTDNNALTFYKDNTPTELLVFYRIGIFSIDKLKRD